MAPYSMTFSQATQLPLDSCFVPVHHTSSFFTASQSHFRLFGCSKFCRVLHTKNCLNIWVELLNLIKRKIFLCRTSISSTAFSLNSQNSIQTHNIKRRYQEENMKLFENAKLDRISTALCMNTADCKIRGRWERGRGGEGGWGVVQPHSLWSKRVGYVVGWNVGVSIYSLQAAPLKRYNTLHLLHVFCP